MFDAVVGFSFANCEMDNLQQRGYVGQFVKRDPRAVHWASGDNAVDCGAIGKTLDQQVPFGLRELTSD